MMAFEMRESKQDEPGVWVLIIDYDTGRRTELHFWSGDVERLQKALKEAGFQ